MQSKTYQILALSCALAFAHAPVIYGAQKAAKFPLCYRSTNHEINIIVVYAKISCCRPNYASRDHDFGKAVNWREKQIPFTLPTGHKLHSIKTHYVGKTDFEINTERALTEREIEGLERGELELAVEDNQMLKAASIKVPPKSPRSTTTTDQPSQE